MELLVDNEQERIHISNDLLDTVEKIAVYTLTEEGVTDDLEISLLIVDDSAIQSLNFEHRGKNQVTDVLSFPLFEDKEGIEAGDMLGDIVISAPRALEQAETYGHTFEREFCFLVVHSLLHLLGYDHEVSVEDATYMEEKQEKILAYFGLTRG